MRPTVDSVTPSSVARGSAATLVVAGSGFLAGVQATASVLGPGGVKVNSIHVVSETELELSVTVDAAAPTGTRKIVVSNPGTSPGPLKTDFGSCSGCLTVT